MQHEKWQFSRNSKIEHTKIIDDNVNSQREIRNLNCFWNFHVFTYFKFRLDSGSDLIWNLVAMKAIFGNVDNVITMILIIFIFKRLSICESFLKKHDLRRKTILSIDFMKEFLKSSFKLQNLFLENVQLPGLHEIIFI